MIAGKKEYQLTADQFYSCIQERLSKNETAKKEIEAIHKFYNGLDNTDGNPRDLMTLSDRERQDLLDIDELITSYSAWYQ